MEKYSSDFVDAIIGKIPRKLPDAAPAMGKHLSRFYEPKWGQSSAGVTTKRIVIDDRPVEAIVIGPSSEHGAVLVTAKGEESTIEVTVDRPWFGHLEGPVTITPKHLISSTWFTDSYKLDLIVHHVPVAPYRLPRAPFRREIASETATTSWALTLDSNHLFPAWGRRKAVFSFNAQADINLTSDPGGYWYRIYGIVIDGATFHTSTYNSMLEVIDEGWIALDSGAGLSNSQQVVIDDKRVDYYAVAVRASSDFDLNGRPVHWGCEIFDE